MDAGNRFSFEAEWFDRFSSLTRKFSIVYYDADGTVEIFEPATRKTFLKRCEPPEGVAATDFFVGASVTLFSRQFKITAFADPATERRLKLARSSTLAIITSDALQHIGSILSAAGEGGLTVGRASMLSLSSEQASDLVANRTPTDQRKIAAQLSRGNVVAVELVGDDAVSRWHGIMGPADPSDARAAAPGSLRALYGRDATANAVYGSASADDASRELGLVFQDGASFTATFTSCTVCIIKPHAVAAGQLPALLDALVSESGLRLTALRSLQFTRQVAEDYLEAYKGVVDEYSRWVAELSSGNSVILELTGDDAVSVLREFAGPFLPDVARHIAPTTLRARFGTDGVRNAVHVTDLPRDGPLESKFLFHVV